MTNETKQTAVDYFAKEIFYTIELLKKGYINDQDLFNSVIVIRDKAKEMENGQSNPKINAAIGVFENLKSKASSVKDMMYLNGVLAVLDSIKNETYGGNE